MGANLKEVRNRIASVKSTQQITKAMKMVSAAKLNRAQDAILKLRPYSDKLDAMLSSILTNTDGDLSVSYGHKREVHRALVVVVTSNRGLCGAFNSNIIKKAEHLVRTEYAGLGDQVDFMCIGKRGYDYFKKRYPAERIIADHVALFDDLSYANVAQVGQWLLEAFDTGTYDAIDVVYGSFKNVAVQHPKVGRFLPVPKRKLEGNDSSKYKADYIFMPDKERLLGTLVPNILKTQFQKYLLDTHASEHGARMTAMDQATENAKELLRDLRISYNKARQEAITNEISEIVGGAAALEGG